jgi:pimeloyl-ACP methyl ester carboxylesterase
MTLLFIHGAGCLSDVFGAQVAAFPNSHAISLPGHGVAGTCSSIEAFADAVEAYVVEHNLHDVVLCGHSMGGAIALTLALRRPAWLRALVLIGSGSRLRVSAEILDGLRSDFVVSRRRIAGLLFGDPSPGRVTAAERAMIEVGAEQTLADFAACNTFDATERLGEIAVATLVLTGERDVMTPPKYAQLLADRVPNGQVRILPGAGHLAMVEQPARVNEELRGFVASLP